MEERPTSELFVSLDQAMAMAIQLHRMGHLSDAAEVYRQILEQSPEYGPALHYSGVLAHQQGRADEALTRLERSLEVDPGQADWYSNLAIVLREQGKVDDAVAACRRALALDPDHANAHNNLGGLLRAQGNAAEAEAAYRDAIRLNPEHADAYTNLGNVLNAQKRTREAVVCFCKAITLNPKHAESRRLLGLAYCTLGELDKAVDVFERWVREEPDNPVPRHMLAACSGRDVPARASDAYVESVFDTFAASFDSRLARLSYRAPDLVVASVAACGFAPKSVDVLDAGCGTGLCGPLLTTYARRLVGVDLSGNMLAQARHRSVYDELIKRELTAYLRESPAAFDVIVSADTLVYFGVLDDVVHAAAAALRPGGVFVFTAEELSGAESTSEYCIKPHGRYSHTRGYVERVLSAAGLRPEVDRAELRMEGGMPVAGLVVKATRVGESHA